MTQRKETFLTNKQTSRGGARKGAGRKANPNKQLTFSIQLPPQIVKRLDQMAERRVSSRAAVIRGMVESFLKNS